MITSFKATSGYAAALPVFSRAVLFEPGLNIVFGPNGCGKSTMLRIMAAYCGIKNGGWTRISSALDMFSVEKTTYPHKLAVLERRGECQADVAWDGTPTFFNHSTADNPGLDVMMDEEDSADGITGYAEGIQLMGNRVSQGQRRLTKLNRIAGMLKQPPRIDTVDESRGPNYGAREFVEYMASLGQAGPSTVLFDEPDRSLATEHQMMLWGMILPKLAAKYQVIVAAHSWIPLMIKYARVNIIDLDPGYLEIAGHLVKWLASKGEVDEANLMVLQDRRTGGGKKAETAPVRKPRKAATPRASRPASPPAPPSEGGGS